MKEKESQNIFLLLGLFLLNLMFFAVVISTILFVIKIPINISNIMLSAAASVLCLFFFAGKSIKRTLKVSIIGLLIFVLITILCAHVYDWSWDGNTYHKSITACLKYGWNPLYETFYTFADGNFPFLSELNETWYDAYPKASEIWGACIYAVSNNIETGKSFNMISMSALFCICLFFLQETNGLKRWQSVLCALLCVLNPVSLSQSITYYNDGFLWQMILLCFVALLYLTFFEHGKWKGISYYFIFLSINMGFNIKFSALIYFAILCLSFFGFWIYKKIKTTGLENTLKSSFFRQRFCLFSLSVISGVLVTGSTSYVINTIRHQNPVYTMIGKGSTEMITAQMPKVFRGMSNITRFICSLFSRTNTDKGLTALELKFPFLFDPNEFWSAQVYDVRTAGWGVLFSGILLISLAVICLALIKYSKTYPSAVQLTQVLMMVVLCSLFIIPGLSWARYFAGLFYIPVGALLYLFFWSGENEVHSQGAAYLAGILACLLLINMVPNFVRNKSTFMEYKETNLQLQQLKELTEVSHVVIGPDPQCLFGGRFFNLIDHDITNFSYGEVDPNECSGTIFRVRSLCYDVRDGIYGAETFTEYLDELYPLEDKLILFAVKDEASKALTDDVCLSMQRLGLNFALKDHFRYAYLAVIDDGNVIYENIGDGRLQFEGEMEEVQIILTSEGKKTGQASIQLDGIEYALNDRGINIVLYDKVSKRVIDSICIDTYLNTAIVR